MSNNNKNYQANKQTVNVILQQPRRKKSSSSSLSAKKKMLIDEYIQRRHIDEEQFAQNAPTSAPPAYAAVHDYHRQVTNNHVSNRLRNQLEEASLDHNLPPEVVHHMTALYESLGNTPRSSASGSYYTESSPEYASEIAPHAVSDDDVGSSVASMVVPAASFTRTGVAHIEELPPNPNLHEIVPTAPPRDNHEHQSSRPSSPQFRPHDWYDDVVEVPLSNNVTFRPNPLFEPANTPVPIRRQNPSIPIVTTPGAAQSSASVHPVAHFGNMIEDMFNYMQHGVVSPELARRLFATPNATPQQQQELVKYVGTFNKAVDSMISHSRQPKQLQLEAPSTHYERGETSHAHDDEDEDAEEDYAELIGQSTTPELESVKDTIVQSIHKHPQKRQKLRDYKDTVDKLHEVDWKSMKRLEKRKYREDLQALAQAFVMDMVMPGEKQDRAFRQITKTFAPGKHTRTQQKFMRHLVDLHGL